MGTQTLESTDENINPLHPYAIYSPLELIRQKLGYPPITDDNTESELALQLLDFQQGLTETLFRLLSNYGQEKEETLTLPLNWHQPPQWLTISTDQIIRFNSDMELGWFQHNDFVAFYVYLRQLTQFVQEHFHRLGTENHSGLNEQRRQLALDWLHSQLKTIDQDHPYQLDSQLRDLNLTHLERTFYAEFISPKQPNVVGSMSELVVQPSMVFLKPAYLSAVQLLAGEINVAECQSYPCPNLIPKVQAAKFCYQCSRDRKKQSDAVIDQEKVVAQVKILKGYASSNQQVFADQIADDLIQSAPLLFPPSTNAQSVAQWLSKNRTTLDEQYQLTYTLDTDSLRNRKVYTFSSK